eukprot:8071285-Ditylum_brightwellii.AAC.1
MHSNGQLNGHQSIFPQEQKCRTEVHSQLQSAQDAATKKWRPQIIKQQQGIHQWQQHETLLPNPSLPQDIKDAFTIQTNIGWYAATKGFLSIKWQQAQDNHFSSINSKRRGCNVTSPTGAPGENNPSLPTGQSWHSTLCSILVQQLSHTSNHTTPKASNVMA